MSTFDNAPPPPDWVCEPRPCPLPHMCQPQPAAETHIIRGDN